MTAPEDYIYTSAKLSLSSSIPQASVTVLVVEDDLLEINETFIAEISLAQIEDGDCVVLHPSTVEITILDNDSKFSFYSTMLHIIQLWLFWILVANIGFVGDNYFVIEASTFVNLTLALISGQLGREVIVMLNTYHADSATSK